MILPIILGCIKKEFECMERVVGTDATELIKKSSVRFYTVLTILFILCSALAFIPEFSVIFIPVIILFSLFFHALLVILIINLHKIYKAARFLEKPYIFYLRLGIFIAVLILFSVACYFFHIIAYFCLAPEIGIFWCFFFVYTVMGIMW
jgi:hypothetical protein